VSDERPAIPQRRTFIVLLDPVPEEKPSSGPPTLPDTVQEVLAEVTQSVIGGPSPGARPPLNATPDTADPRASCTPPESVSSQPPPTPPVAEPLAVTQAVVTTPETLPCEDEPSRQTTIDGRVGETTSESDRTHSGDLADSPPTPRRIRVPRKRLGVADDRTDTTSS
jgi:hypothetical protein